MLAGWLAFHFLIGFAGTWLARRYALRRDLVDQPGERRSHSAATPRGGGIAIVASMVLSLAAMAWRLPEHLAQLALAAAGMLLVAGIGWLDDHRPLSPWSRLAIHIVAAALLACAVAIGGATGVDVALAFVAALVLTNVWNFMDGIDGLAASQAALVAGACALMGGDVMLYAGLAMVASILGFLPHNFPRARIFLGDVGSGALGYALAALMAYTAMPLGGGAGAWALVLLPAMVFLVDASLTLASRVLRGERWWQPHVQHAYQCWARAVGHQKVTWGFAAATFTAIMLMFAIRSSSAPFRIVMIGVVGLAGGAGWYWLRGWCRRMHEP